MGLEQTIEAMRDQLKRLCHDLEKAARGNRTAAQRVRTGTISLARVAKEFRQESIAEEKKKAGKKK